MFESARDLVGVLLGLIALWFILGTLLDDERLRGQGAGHRPVRRQSSARRHGAARPAGR